MSKQDNNLFDMEIILDESGNYKRLMPVQLNYVPRQGDYYAVHADNKVYEIKSVIHEDLHIILVVTETDTNLSSIISIVYGQSK
jgi:hypothetical protein